MSKTIRPDLPNKFSNRILILTLLAILIIAIFSAYLSYKSQVRISEEKELFKLDCIASATAYKISGEDHSYLVEAYPNRIMKSKAIQDSIYRKIKQLMDGAQEMTKVPSEMYTVLSDTSANQLYFGIGTVRSDWLAAMEDYPEALLRDFEKGGMVRSHVVNGSDKLSAFSPIRDANNNVVSVLQVEETRDAFMDKSLDQIMVNVYISLGFIAIIGTLMYFSVRNLLKRQERIALEKIELDGLRRELVTNVSHDLRTPLASIHGYIETVLMKFDSLSGEEIRKYLNTSLQGTEKLRGLVDELFELSKLESRERKLNEELLSLGELAHDVCNQFRPQATQEKIDIQTKIPSSLPRVKGDIALIDRVLQNVIGNSLKFCEGGDIILVSAGHQNGRVWVEISDSGAGIPTEDLPHIFDRFHKGKSRRSGSGLGLAIVKSILELHGATYHLNSTEGQGTTFRFDLPVVQVS